MWYFDRHCEIITIVTYPSPHVTIFLCMCGKNHTNPLSKFWVHNAALLIRVPCCTSSSLISLASCYLGLFISLEPPLCLRQGSSAVLFSSPTHVVLLDPVPVSWLCPPSSCHSLFKNLLPCLSSVLKYPGELILDSFWNINDLTVVFGIFKTHSLCSYPLSPQTGCLKPQKCIWVLEVRGLR